MAAPPRISTLARGTAEGAIVLEIERGVTEAAVGLAAQAIRRYPGIWGFQLDQGEDWDSPAIASLRGLADQHGIAMLTSAEFGPLTWPSFDLVWILDASAVVRSSADERQLAVALGEPWLPEIRDLVIDLAVDQPPPTPACLAMLEAAIRPSCGYLYVPIDYAFRALAVQAVAATSPNWSVRWIR